MSSCEEAIFYYKHCGLTYLDGDGDGIPCENLCNPSHYFYPHDYNYYFSREKTFHNRKLEEKSQISPQKEPSIFKNFPWGIALFLFGISLLIFANLLRWFILPAKGKISRAVGNKNKIYANKYHEFIKISVDKKYFLKGDTYPFKEEIKILGGKWNSHTKAWEISGLNLREFINKHLPEIGYLKVKPPYVIFKLKIKNR